MSLLRFTLHLRLLTSRYAVTQWLTVLLALTVPISTTATGIASALLFSVYCFRGDFQKLRWHWRNPVILASAAFIALFPLGAMWSSASLEAMGDHTGQYLKIAFIPLIAHVVSHGQWSTRVMIGGLAATIALLAVSGLHLFVPEILDFGRIAHHPGVPLKSHFILNISCALAAYALVSIALHTKRTDLRLALIVTALSAVLYVVSTVPARTGVVVMSALVVLLIWQNLGPLRAMVLTLVASTLAVAVFAGVPATRERFQAIQAEITAAQTSGSITSSGIRMSLYERGLEAVKQRPLLGHGTGSTSDVYEATRTGRWGNSEVITDDPHNQLLAVAIPFGALGLIVLTGLWAVHWRIFAGASFSHHFGQAVVVQSIVSGLFLSPLYMFALGWLYVVLVGACIGAIWREQRRALAVAPQERP